MSAPSSTLTEPAPAAELRSLRKVFAAGVIALDDVSLDVPEGEISALLGPNGSGKSTIMRILAGSDREYDGTARILGHDVSFGVRGLRSRIGYATQRPALDPELTGMEHLRLFHALRGLPVRERDSVIQRQVDDFGLSDFVERATAGYSGGERQRLHLSIETIHTPHILLLDEPTSNLDPDGRRDLWNRIRLLRDGGRTIVIATHDLDEVEGHADRVVILNAGRVVADDSIATLLAKYRAAGALLTVETDIDDETARLIRDALAKSVDIVDYSLRRRFLSVWRSTHPASAHDPVLDILSDLDIHVERYERIHPGLAGAYFRLTGGRGDGLEGSGRKADGGGRNRR